MRGECHLLRKSRIDVTPSTGQLSSNSLCAAVVWRKWSLLSFLSLLSLLSLLMLLVCFKLNAFSSNSGQSWLSSRSAFMDIFIQQEKECILLSVYCVVDIISRLLWHWRNIRQRMLTLLLMVPPRYRLMIPHVCRDYCSFLTMLIFTVS